VSLESVATIPYPSLNLHQPAIPAVIGVPPEVPLPPPEGLPPPPALALTAVSGPAIIANIAKAMPNFFMLIFFISSVAGDYDSPPFIDGDILAFHDGTVDGS
jgi:hypothetical protein